LTKLPADQLRKQRAKMQMVFQDPYASLNPRMTVYSMVSEPLLFHRKIASADCPLEAAGLLGMVGLDIGSMRKFPHEFSGDSASALPLPAPWPWARSLSSPMSRCRPWMFRSRRKSSIFYRTCEKTWALQCFLFPMICRSYGTFPTGLR